MAKHMLIDATHPEEIRVVVVDGKRLEEFDIELASKKQLKGNIYLAKVTRVEPSLQAAFVEYGGNRHGFLAFSEIHPDYYRIPVADREALLAEEAREAAAENAREEAREAAAEARGRRRGRGRAAEAEEQAEEAEDQAEFDSDTVSHDGAEGEDAESENRVPQELWPAQALGYAGDRLASPEVYDIEDEEETEVSEAVPPPAPPAEAEPARDVAPATEPESQERDGGAASSDAAAETTAPATADEPAIAEAAPTPIETIGGDEIEEVQPRRSPRALRSYKIQEVIKRRQVMLVQVTKEERGTKGAALTTYLSLAGRYCVLMPNTARGGGVSRKISNPADRKRLKAILEELDIPSGMAVIIRTAGAERSKAELKRDYEYLLRLWDEIRELTLKSTAPALVYEEANLIKRSIRDVYSRDIEDVIVEGEEGYKIAKSFMRTLTPSHAKRVQLYRDPMPLFHRYQVESQLDAIHNPVVQLKSGGYIVINSTEALVAIDVNSGRATRERNIEETAYKTNLEAAEEIARQLRLRDLAGLIVIDFIDMEESRHNGAVERKLKEAMRHDRARIQIGRISAFGLLELSRQRMRPSLFETSTEICKYCRGTGHVRSTESTVLHVLRSIEDECLKSRNAAGLTVAVPTPVALYILNHKRKALAEIELRHGLRIFVTGDDHLIPPEYRVERIKALAPGEQVRPPVMQTTVTPAVDEIDEEDIDEGEEAELAEAAAEAREDEEAGGDERRRKRSRRRRRGRDRDRHGAGAPDETIGEAEPQAAVAEAGQAEEGAEAEAGGQTEMLASPAETSQEEHRRRRRRGRRGGRRRRRQGESQAEFEAATAESAQAGEFGEAEGYDAVEEAGVPAEPPSQAGVAEAAPPAEVVPEAPAVEPAEAGEPERPSEEPRHEEQPRAEEQPREERQPEPVAAMEASERPQEEEPQAERPQEQPTALPPSRDQAEDHADRPESGEAAPASPPRRGWWRRLAQ